MRYIITAWLTEFGPLGLFFLSFELFGFFAATRTLIVATLVVLFATFYREKRIPHFPVFIAALVVSFGWATLHFQNPQYLIFEVSLYNFLLAFGIFASLSAKRNIFQHFFSRLLAISQKGWNTLAVRCGAYFMAQAVLNEIVRLNFEVRTWVHFRMGMLGVLAVFGIVQFFLTRRERLPEGNAWGLRTAKPKVGQR